MSEVIHTYITALSLLSLRGSAVPKSSHLVASEVSLYKTRLFELISELSVLPGLREELPRPLPVVIQGQCGQRCHVFLTGL